MTRLTLLRTTPSVARFSAIVATAPWPSFTFEINPLRSEPRTWRPSTRC